MIDPRFFTNAGPFRLDEVADRVGGRLSRSAPPDFMVTDLATLDEATGSELSMFGDHRYRGAFVQSQAGAILTSTDFASEPSQEPAGGPHLIFVANPRLAHAEAAWLFYPKISEPMGLEDRRAEAELGEGCLISPTATLGPRSRIGARTVIGANAVIGAGVILGEDCVIGPNVTIGFAILGDRVQVYPGVVIGAQGFGFVPGSRGLRRVPQLGRVIIGNDVEIGVNSAIDRGAIGDTIVGDGTVIDNLIQIGHNVRIGRSCVLSGQAGIAGSAVIGDGAMVGGAASIADHVVVGASARIAGRSGVTRDIEAGSTVAGYPALPVRDWHRQTAGLARMFSRLHRRV